jgi:hypothetical protein
MKIILSVIAVCLVMITVKLYTPLALAEQQLTKREIHRIIEACDFDGWVDDRYSVRGYDLVRGELDC